MIIQIKDPGPLDLAYAAVQEKLKLYPGHLFYDHARIVIDYLYVHRHAINLEVLMHKAREIGLMCVRELESEDRETCEKIYDMNEYLYSLTGMSDDEIIIYNQKINR